MTSPSATRIAEVLERLKDPAAQRTYDHHRVEPITMGEYSYISEWCHISQYTKIGRYCSIANLCTIGAQPHTILELTTYPVTDEYTPTETIIGNDVWIGSSSIILAGVTIGDGAVVGAGSVVTKSVPPYAIVVGNEAKLLRYRFSPEVIAELLASKWWEMSIEEVAKLQRANVSLCLEQLRARA